MQLILDTKSLLCLIEFSIYKLLVSSEMSLGRFSLVKLLYTVKPQDGACACFIAAAKNRAKGRGCVHPV